MTENSQTASEKLAAFVNAKMSEKGLNAISVAHEANTSHQYIYLIKGNLTKPSINNVEKILRGIGETWETFIEYMRAS